MNRLSKCASRSGARVLSFIVWMLLLFSTSQASYANSFDCDSDNCGLYSDAAYPNLMLGKVTAIATDAEAKAVYLWTRSHEYWTELSDDLPRFIRSIQMVAIDIPGMDGSESVTLLMGRDHFSAIEIRPGDTVRYIPHGLAAPAAGFTDPASRAYWDLFGCIAVLCRADDKNCPDLYVSGVYGLDDGIRLNLHTGLPSAEMRRIDTGTYLPL